MNNSFFLIVISTVLCWTSLTQAIENASGSYFKTIAIPFERVLLRAIPQRNRDLFKPEDVVTTGDGKLFLIRPHARALIYTLNRQGYKVVLLTSLTKDSDVLAKSISMNTKGSLSLAQLAQVVPASYPANTEEVWDTKSLGLGPNALFLVDNKLKINSDAHALNLGPIYYAYPTFEKLKENKPATSDEYFANTEEEWFLEFNNLARAFSNLSSILKGDLIEAQRAILAAENRSQKQPTIDGVNELNYIFQPYTFKFVKSPDGTKYLGCERTDNRTKARTIATLLECAEQVTTTFYAYKNLKKSNCSIFDEENVEISPVDVHKCDEFIVFNHPKTNTLLKLRVIAGMESMSESEFFRRIFDAPTDANPYRLYDPTNVLAKKDHLNYLDCYRATNRRNLQAFDSTGKLLESCKLDTVYSWGTEAKLNILISQMGNVNPWKTIQTLYTTRGPFSTFGYGSIAIRIKLKKDVIFKRTDSHTRCDHANSTQAATTVYVRAGDQYRDWTICNTGVIHSWSFFNREHYDEIVKDYLHHQELLKSGVSISGYIEQYDSAQQAQSIFGAILDRHPFTEDILIQNLRLFIKKIAELKEQIFYNPDLPASEKNREAHFRTNYPTYFNER